MASCGREQVTWLSLPFPFTFQINIILLIIVLRKALSTHVMLARTQLQKIRAGIKAAIVSLPLLGVTWTFGLLAFNSDTIFFKYMFAISNSLQGLMIFVFHCALNKQVKTGYSEPLIWLILLRRYREWSDLSGIAFSLEGFSFHSIVEMTRSQFVFSSKTRNHQQLHHCIRL